jgi:hypothetical protein
MKIYILIEYNNYPEQYEHLKDMIYKYENNLPPFNKEKKDLMII